MNPSNSLSEPINNRNPQSSTPSRTPSSGSGSAQYRFLVDPKQSRSPKVHPPYRLLVRQEPNSARICSFKDKIDRRPLDPPPIIEIQSPGHEPELHTNSNLCLIAYLVDVHTDREVRSDSGAKCTAGTIVQSPHRLRDLSGRFAVFFAFPDISIRQEGTYRLEFRLYSISVAGRTSGPLVRAFTAPFRVVPPKFFPGMASSSALTRHLAEQGFKLRVRKKTRTPSNHQSVVQESQPAKFPSGSSCPDKLMIPLGKRKRTDNKEHSLAHKTTDSTGLFGSDMSIHQTLHHFHISQFQPPQFYKARGISNPKLRQLHPLITGSTKDSNDDHDDQKIVSDKYDGPAVTPFCQFSIPSPPSKRRLPRPARLATASSPFRHRIDQNSPEKWPNEQPADSRSSWYNPHDPNDLLVEFPQEIPTPPFTLSATYVETPTTMSASSTISVPFAPLSFPQAASDLDRHLYHHDRQLQSNHRSLNDLSRQKRRLPPYSEIMALAHSNGSQTKYFDKDINPMKVRNRRDIPDIWDKLAF